jgi:hypothetical protein
MCGGQAWVEGATGTVALLSLASRTVQKIACTPLNSLSGLIWYTIGCCRKVEY